MKTTFDLNQAFKKHGTHEHRSQEKMSIKKDSLWLLVNLQFEKSLFNNQNLIKKSSSYCMNRIAYNCILSKDYVEIEPKSMQAELLKTTLSNNTVACRAYLALFEDIK